MRYLLLIFSFLVFSAQGQPITISGVIKSPSGENVPYASVVDSVNNKSVYSDINGYFSILTKGGTCSLKFSHVSYSPAKLHVVALKDTFMTVSLTGIEMPEVLVKGTSLSQQAMLGVSFMEGKTIQNIPSFFGEPDLVKAMTVLPGISGGLDLYSSIYVRGGNRDQNLFLVDGARYYTTSHAGGYLSLFNPDIISHVDIYKGIAPAKYGDGVSAVVDVRLNEGSDKPKLNVDIGTMRSGFVFESKGSGKVYGILAGRISQIDLITGSAFKEFVDIKDLEDDNEYYIFNFWDFDGKICYKPSSRTSIALNGHIGNDEDAAYTQGGETIEGLGTAKYTSTNGNYIDNHNLTLNVRHIFPLGVTLKNTAWFTYYNLTHRSNIDYFISTVPAATVFYEKSTYIKDFTEKLELNMQLGANHFGKAGFQLSSFTVNPSVGSQSNSITSVDEDFGYKDQRAIEWAIFIDDDYKVLPTTTLRLGLRSSLLSNSDTSYISVEPRILLSQEISPDWSIKVGYSKCSQPIHSLVQTYGDFEKESWILSDTTIRPQMANQFSGGIFGKLPGTSIELSFEVYYKEMDNLLFLNPIGYDAKNMFDYLHRDGKGRSYGSEMLVQKTNGKLQWSIAYTLSWSERKFETINSGDWFYSEFDRRHNLNVGLHYFSGKKNSWNFNYIYQSGRPFTMPVAYIPQTSFYTGFYALGGANNARSPYYSRFDVSYKRKFNILWGRKSELTLSVLNLFARKNPLSVYAKDGKLYMTSRYVVIPSVNYKLYIF